MIRFTFLSSVILTLLAGFSSAASGAAWEVTEFSVGVNGVWKTGVWTPVQITLTPSAQTPAAPMPTHIRLTIPDGDRVPVRYTFQVRKEGESLGRASGCIRFGRIATPVRCELLAQESDAENASNTVLSERWFEPTAAPHDESDAVVGTEATNEQNVEAGPKTEISTHTETPNIRFYEGVPAALPIWLVISHEPLPLETAFAGMQLPSGRRPKLVHLSTFAELPTEDAAWSTFERVVLSASDAEELLTTAQGERLPANASQFETFGRWIRRGGRFVATLSGSAADVLCGPEGALAPLAPGVYERTVPLRETTELENMLAQPVPIPRVDGRIEFAVPQFRALKSEVRTLVSHGTLPLLMRYPYGFGEVTLLGIPLNDPQMAQWSSRGGMMASLLEFSPISVTGTTVDETLMHQGFDDHAGQLRGSLDQFPGVQVPPFWLFVLFCIAFLLIIGPLDYFFECRLLKRPGLIGLVVVCAAICAAVPYALRQMKGDQLRMNQVELIDIDTVGGEVRGQLWCDFFSPTAQRLQLAFDPTPVQKLLDSFPDTAATVSDTEIKTDTAINPDTPTSDTRTDAPSRSTNLQNGVIASWFGLPGASLGGLDMKSGRWNQTAITYDADLADEMAAKPAGTSFLLRGVPVAIGSTKHFEAQWFGKTEPQNNAELTESRGNRTITGTVTNPLSIPLDHVLLVHGNWVWRLGSLGPHGVAVLTSTSQRFDKKQFFYWPQLTGKSERQSGGRYNAESTDPSYALQAMMFYESMGGHAATRLANGFEGGVDASGALSAGRAVLVASIPAEYQTQIRVQCGVTPSDEVTSAKPVAPTTGDQRLIFLRWYLPVITD